MAQRIGELSSEEFEALVERAVDRRLRVWLDQVVDALTDLGNEDESELQPVFEAALRRSIRQAQSGDRLDLQSVRNQIGR